MNVVNILPNLRLDQILFFFLKSGRKKFGLIFSLSYKACKKSPIFSDQTLLKNHKEKNYFRGTSIGILGFLMSYHIPLRLYHFVILLPKLQRKVYRFHSMNSNRFIPSILKGQNLFSFNFPRNYAILFSEKQPSRRNSIKKLLAVTSVLQWAATPLMKRKHHTRFCLKKLISLTTYII